MQTQFSRNTMVLLVAVAGLILLITSGVRMSLGLFVQPLTNEPTLDIVSVSFAMAVCQLMWGVAQPISDALADKFGSRWVLIGGAVLLALACLLTPVITTPFGVTLTLGLLLAFGTGAGSFSVLMGRVANRTPASWRGTASGIINASSSFGQFTFALMLQPLILSPVIGWRGAMVAMAFCGILTIPLAWWLSRPVASTQSLHSEQNHQTEQKSLGESLKIALNDRSYRLIHLAFFTCGFHVAFLTTHLPSEITLAGLKEQVASVSLALIGLSNVLGSLFVGWCVGRYRSKYILFWMYLSRALLVVIYLYSPKTTITFYLFAISLGLTWLATVPPTAAAVSKLFGVRYLATLFGLTLVSHQIGAFLGAYLGGLAISYLGDYQWMWYADMVLATLAAVVNLPIREPKMA